MKFKTLLLASAAVLVAAPAFAADDITAAFYTPAKGHFLSDTTLQGTRLKSDYDDLGKSLAVTEELNYGVTDNLAVFGAISNNFDVEGLYNNDHNFAYDLGVAYTMNYGKVLGQAVLGYHTFDPRTWWGKDIDSNRWGKELYATAKLGYAFDCGLTPYTTFTMVGDIDNAAYARVGASCYATARLDGTQTRKTAMLAIAGSVAPPAIVGNDKNHLCAILYKATAMLAKCRLVTYWHADLYTAYIVCKRCRMFLTSVAAAYTT